MAEKKAKPKSSDGAEPALTFDQRLAELERIAAALESGDLGLEAALEQYKLGAGLLRSCRTEIESIRAQVQELSQTGSGPDRPFAGDPDLGGGSGLSIEQGSRTATPGAKPWSCAGWTGWTSVQATWRAPCGIRCWRAANASGRAWYGSGAASWVARCRRRSPAGAIEFVHTYSLVHDDLPCMDDDALRRGQPTTHVVFGEANAVLAGDGLLTLAFEVLAHGAGPALADMCRVLAQAAGPAGMVGGQHLDLEAEGQELDAEAVGTIHRLKTACLISAACELGALAAGADAARCAVAREYGRQLGLCFQAVDDLLDVTGAAPDLGKTPGKDEASGKATLVRALGLEGATARAREHAEAARAALAPLGLDPTSPCFTLVDWLL
ncbi:MAG: exodeoxyribonuclease VII small subunit [Planctomycetota bacterium]